MPIAGLISKNRCDVSKQIRSMLSMMRHHERARVGVAVGNSLALDGEELIFNSLKPGNDKAIGHCGFLGEDGNLPFQPLFDSEGKFFLVIDGRIYNFKDVEKALPHHRFRPHRDVYQIASLFEDALKGDDYTVAERVSKVVTRFHGSFSLAIMDGRHIVVVRDVVGVEPLYWGENERYHGFASERKALWKTGIKNVSALPPGCIAVISNKAVFQHRAMALERPKVVDISLEDAAERLKKILQRTFNVCLQGVREVGVFFSGGVDSSLVAKCIMDLGVTPVLYVAGFEDSHDVGAAEKSAEELACPLCKRIISLDEVEDYVSKVVYAVEEDDLMKVSVGLPLYLAAESAMKGGVGTVFSGQGVDELFGGYSRYCRTLERRGREGLAEELWKDVLHLADVNLQRDKGIALVNSVDLVLPFLDLDVIHTALSFPTHLKVDDSKDSLRKHVLRETARLFGLSEDVAMLPKKAMQYGSGSHKAIKSIAKTKGYRNSRDYVRSVFREVFREIA